MRHAADRARRLVAALPGWRRVYGALGGTRRCRNLPKSLSHKGGSGDARLRSAPPHHKPVRAGTLLHTLRGHSDRLGRCAFHPAGLHFATAGFDTTWRLWDLATGVELLCQEGHSRAVYTVCFQPDGALALSGGLDGHARVWDMRTGRSVLTLSGHVRAVLAADWSPDGHTIATGAGDACCRVWDARKGGACIATLPAHAGLVTAVRFEPAAGGTLLTASHDGTFKLWQAPRWGLLRSVRAGEGRVMDADLAPNANLVATASYDRTVKIWQIPAEAASTDVCMLDAL